MENIEIIKTKICFLLIVFTTVSLQADWEFFTGGYISNIQFEQKKFYYVKAEY